LTARYCIFPSRSSKEDLSYFPSISVEVEFRDLMMEYSEVFYHSFYKTNLKASTRNRAKALFRYLVVKEPKNEAKD